jgi:hypothetical protein
MNKFLHFNVPAEKGASLKERKKYQSRTAVVEPLSAQSVKDIASNFISTAGNVELSVALNLGVTLLSLKDRYSKKEGRAEATKRLKQVILDVKAVQITQNHIFVQLTEHRGITFILRLNKTTGFCTVVGSLTVGG